MGTSMNYMVREEPFLFDTLLTNWLGTDDELATRLNQFDAHVERQREKLHKEERARQDLEDDLAKLRQEELDLSEKKAHFEAEALVCLNGAPVVATHCNLEPRQPHRRARTTHSGHV
jgi:predicted nuclease with TOPRIM domain